MPPSLFCNVMAVTFNSLSVCVIYLKCFEVYSAIFSFPKLIKSLKWSLLISHVTLTLDNDYYYSHES